MAEQADLDQLGSVEVNYSVGDIVGLQIASWRVWMQTALAPFVFFGLLSLMSAVTGKESFLTAVSSIEWPLAGILSLALIVVRALALSLGYAIRRFRGKHNNIIFGLDDQGAKFRGPDGHGTIFWKSLKRVSSNEKRLMLFLSRSSAFIVPKRCFSDPATFDRWVEFSNARWSAARNQSQS